MLVTALCIGVALFWWAAALVSFLKAKDTRFRIHPSSEDGLFEAVVSVVVPARNEEANIAECVDAILRQNIRDLRVVVVNDGSTDGTAQRLETLSDSRLSVVTSSADEALPTGWLGKPWACQRGGERALQGAPLPEFLVFVDADVRLQNGALAALVQYSRTHSLGLLSVMGTLTMTSFWEWTIQPAVVGLILAGNDLAKINDPQRRPERPLANGQLMVFARDEWRNVGGHGAVKGEIIDDVGMAAKVTASGGRYHLVFGPRLFSCRMYSSFDEIWNGWTKNIFEGMGASWAAVSFLVLFVCIGVLAPYGVAISNIFLADTLQLIASLAAVLGMISTRWQLDRRFGQNPWRAWSLPIGWAVLALMAVRSGFRYQSGQTVWKGRVVG